MQPDIDHPRFRNQLFEAAMEDLRRDTAKPPARAKFPIQYLSTAVIVVMSLYIITHQFTQAPKPATVIPAPTPAAVTMPPPLPEVRKVIPMPVPVSTTAPRAKLLHVRPIGTVENDQMPDGRVLTTRYMGELSGAGNLPTRGANLGDMWYTQNDGHCWVLAPLPGSSTVGWIDP